MVILYPKPLEFDMFVNWDWEEESADGELFEDAYGTVSNKRRSCTVCYATGTDYGETCVCCGGLGWVCFKD